MTKKVVLFLPGFQREEFDPARKGAKIKEALEKKGFEVAISNYGHRKPMKEPIDVYVEQVKEEIRLLKPTAIVAHCMSGLVVRNIIENCPEDLGVKKLIMLETPNNGTTSLRMRMLGLPNWQPIRDMVKGSEFLRRLNADWQKKQRELKTRYFQIGGDRTIDYPKIFKLSGVETITFRGVGHSQLRTDSQVIQKIIEILMF